LATSAYVLQAVLHPAIHQPQAGRFIATQAGFLAWVGVACVLLSMLLARRTALVARLADSRSRLLADALEAEQRERKALAEALHDDAIQNLLSARHQLEEADEAQPHPALGRADDALVVTLGQLRDAVFELHPYVLEQAGLEPALRTIAQHAASRAGVKMDLDLSYRDRHPREQLVFSAARELLANVAQHAEATRVIVRLAEDDGDLRLVVEDDGRGFPPERLAERLAEGHVGLASQRLRIEAAGGSMHVASAPGEGTRVEIRVPVRGGGRSS
jgi:two-component system NarL family sensor kinase